MIELIVAHPHAFWLSLGGLLLAAEMLGTSGYLLWSGMAAVLVGLLVWLVPMFTVCMTFLLWHGFGEHIREKEGCLSQNTFTHKFDPITKLFIYPIQSGYHLEHHLYPQLPWYNMAKFRKWAELRPEYKELASELEADAYFYGKKTIVEMSFSV